MAETSTDGGTRRRKKRVEPVATAIFDRPLPSSQEAERGVVGAILLNPSVCDEVATLLRPDDFYSNANRIIYQKLLDMNSASSGIDLTLLVERLSESGELAEIGGQAYLAELMSSVQVALHAKHYANIVREKAVRRDIIETASSVLESVYEPEQTSRDLLNLAEEKIFAIGDSRNTNRVQSMEDIMMEALNIIDSRSGSGMEGIPTGYTDLDRMLGGLHKSELVILAARPSMGKTALAVNIAEHVAVEEKQPVLFFSLEMSKTELAFRFLCSRGRIRGERMRGNFLSEREQKSLVRTASELSAAAMYMDDSPSRTVTEIGSVARRLKRQHGLGLIVIDYLGLIEPDNASDPRQEQVAKIARRLKGLARELDVPVLCLAQLNRQAEQSKDNRPRLSHLRESGAIEQDADVVMFIHREDPFQSSDEADDKRSGVSADVIVAKQRNGPVGDVNLVWFSEYTLFANAAKDSQGNYTSLETDPEDLDSFSSGRFE